MAALAKTLRAATDNEDVDLGGYGQVMTVAGSLHERFCMRKRAERLGTPG